MGDYMKAEEIRDSGYLCEANRLFFHPLGLALALHMSDDGPFCKGSLGILDYRGDLEGVYYGQPLDDVRRKAGYVAEALRRRSPARMASLGYIVQPLADDPLTALGIVRAEVVDA